ncbi:iron-containing alcohol dehydrogenase family protein [Variovorax ureilyticus]|uniref:Iron-containing alcohol dehydrogenase family protein n=1 Tax=Variovorax ureilyticus TaxID=1836198 RepID=A0ABU8VM42_9BURK
MRAKVLLHSTSAGRRSGAGAEHCHFVSLMQGFQHITAPLRLFYGDQSLHQLGPELDRLGCNRAMVICGRSISRDSSVLQPVLESLGSRCAGTFGQVVAHSPLQTVRAAAASLRESVADAVVVVGGGSAIITARAASILCAEDADLRQLCTRRGEDGRLVSPKLSAPKVPQFLIPTTPTTACLKAGSAVFDPTHGRLALFDPKTRAQAVFVHPDLVATAPAGLVVTASLSTLSMVVEGLESARGDLLSDADLMQALRLLERNLPVDHNGIAGRGELIVAALLCGRGTDIAGGGIAAVLAHAIGARYQIANGLVSAVLLPHTLRFNAAATGARLGKVAMALGRQCGGSPVEDGIAIAEALLMRLGSPRRLRELGVPRDALASIAEDAMSDWFIQKNPRRINHSGELEVLLDAAW